MKKKELRIPQPHIRALLTGLFSTAAIGLAPQLAAAQSISAQQDIPGEPETSDRVARDILVTGARDLAGVVQKGSSSTLFGIDTPLVDTPRSVTAIDEKLLSRYNIKSVYDFTTVAAGTFTGSFFGVPGAIAIRGSMADNYFNGFQGIPNAANFPTPVDASSAVEIVRGPPSPVFGAGQVGGMLNFIPKSGRGDETKYVTRPTGDASITVGSYDQKEATANLALPVKWGTAEGGLALYGKLEDSDSFYRGMHPKSQVGQATYSTDIGSDFSFSVTYQYLHSDGYLKNIGWNRVTQELIDDQVYISGRPVEQIVAPGAEFITKTQFYAVTGGRPVQLYAPGIGLQVRPNDFTTLDPATVGQVKLSPRTTFLDPECDINEARAHTGYGSLAWSPSEGTQIKFESFINTLDSRNYQSYGFATVFDATVTEQRLTAKSKTQLGDLELQGVAGLSYRHSKSHDLGSLNDFVLSEDRRDLSVGATPDDRFNDPFRSGPDYPWATSTFTRISDVAGFVVGNATWRNLGITAGARLDNYDVRSVNRGAEVTGIYTPRSDNTSPLSYNASVSYKLPLFTVYATYAKAKSLQLTQGGSINPSLIPTGAYLGGSELKEAGIKSSQAGGRFYAAVDVYEQTRSYLSQPATGVATVSAIRSRGVEAEMRWLATDRLGLTLNGTYQRTKQLPTAGSGVFVTYPSCLTNVECTQGYGGYIYSLTNYLGLTDGYYLRTVPKFSGAAFATYDYKGRWGLTGGVTYASGTGGFLPGAIKIPSYALVKAGAYAVAGPVRVDFNLDNLFDKLYFITNSDTDANANVLPGVGRTFHVKATYAF
jgi:iron complex outermembrane receptor protein